MMFATGRPTIVIDTARARRPGGTIDAPTTAPIPKNAPCGTPDRKRAAIRNS
jgi:hypothetical protein